MKSRHIYMCDFCDYENDNATECETHEAKHVGNGLSLEEYRDRKGLNELVARTSTKVNIAKNSETESEFEDALKND